VLGLFRYSYFGLVAVIAATGSAMLRTAEPEQELAAGKPAAPNTACAPCHREIYERYGKTPMAHASGPATEGFLPADFLHGGSGVHYRVTEEDGHVWLSYAREDSAPDRAMSGRQELRYFIGSGKRGRTYLFEQQGYWFESPVNWYARKQVWDMAPSYQGVREMPLTLEVDPGCLHCHTTGTARSLKDARNHYSGEPFASGGIACVSCHGDGSAHMASGGKVRMIKIDALEGVRRDSVCLSCHLEGQVAVVRENKDLESFVAGDNLFDYELFFVYKSENGSGGRATSQWEALLRSECKRKSGDRLTCTTCHDPHGSPPAEKRVAFYRQKCLQCHNQAGFEQKHHPENPDCTECHMARPPSNDIAHEQVTDHWIRKRVTEARLPLATKGELETVGGEPADDRDLGMAYAQMAERGDQDAGIKALSLFLHAEQESGGAREDHELHARLGFLEQVNGQRKEAAAEYGQALAADPYDELAAGDLAFMAAERKDFAEAERLWGSLVEHDPSEKRAAMDLAIVECNEGKREEALRTLGRLLEFSPDDSNARGFAERIRAGGSVCGTK
jgi:predicted CXXCH cytochrome family protein